MKPKYEMTEDYIEHKGHTLRQIRALKKIPQWGIKKGELGGYIESENNLSQNGNCWVEEGSYVYDRAIVYENALVCGTARVFGYAGIAEESTISENACVYGHAIVFGSARIYGFAKVHGQARVYGEARVGKKSNICGRICVSDTIIS